MMVEAGSERSLFLVTGCGLALRSTFNVSLYFRNRRLGRYEVLFNGGFTMIRSGQGALLKLSGFEKATRWCCGWRRGFQ